MITPRQKEQRRKSIGSSDAAVVLKIHPTRTLYDLWLEKTGRTDGFEGNEATQRGEYLEDGILRWAADKLGEKVVKAPNSFVYRTDEGVTFRAHVDGMMGKAAKGSPIVEAKNYMWGADWGGDGDAEIPLPIYAQVQHQMMCAESDEAYVARLSAKGFTLHPVDPDPDIQRAIIEQGSAFWLGYVETDEAPPIEGVVSDSALSYMQRAYHTDGTDTTLDDEHMEMYLHWHEVEAEAAERKKFHKAKIMGSLGEAKRGVGEKFQVTMVAGGGHKALDQKALRAGAPEVYAKYTKKVERYHYPKITKRKESK